VEFNFNQGFGIAPAGALACAPDTISNRVPLSR
jgi:hypothetical protein